MHKPIYIETPESERKYRRLKALSQQLRIPVMEMFLEVEVSHKGVITHHFKQRSHSWTRNAYNMLLVQMAGIDVVDSTFAAGKLSGKTTAGTIYGANNNNMGFPFQEMKTGGQGYTGASGSNSMGIQFGNNTQAESFEDYAMVGLIANGTSSGNLSYALGQPYVASYDIPSKTWTVTIVRFANNNTGLTTSVNEIGLVGLIFVSNAGNVNVMVSRDHLSSTISVLDSGQIRATYTLSLTFPG